MIRAEYVTAETHDHGEPVSDLDWKTALLWMIALVASVAAVIVFALDAQANDAHPEASVHGPTAVATQAPPFLPKFCVWSKRPLVRPVQPAPRAATPVDALRAAAHGKTIPNVTSPSYWLPLGDYSSGRQSDFILFLDGEDLTQTKNQKVLLHAVRGNGRSTAVVVRRDGSSLWRVAGWNTGTCSI